MNLVEADILTSPVFSFLPKFSSVIYKGILTDKVSPQAEKIRYFEAEKDGEKISVFTLMFIRNEEKFFWESCCDLLDRAMTQAAAEVEGVFSFDLLSFDVHRELKTFSDQELSRLVINHGRRLAPGQERLIKYSSCFALLRKLSHEDWGKIVFKTAVEVFAKEPEKLDSLVKKVVTATTKQSGPKIIVIHDLSQEPVLNPTNQPQQEALAKVLAQQQNLFEAMPQVYLCDKNGVRK